MDRALFEHGKFARVAKGVDLRSTAGNCAWVRTPQLATCATSRCCVRHSLAQGPEAFAHTAPAGMWDAKLHAVRARLQFSCGSTGCVAEAMRFQNAVYCYRLRPPDPFILLIFLAEAI